MRIMNVFKKIIFLLLFWVMFAGIAQQNPNQVLYRNTLQLINPAAIGTEKTAVAALNIRSQWQGIEGAPRSQTFLGSIPLTQKIGLGLSVSNDKTFIEKQTGLYLDFSYKLRLSRFENLYLGLKAGGNFFDVNAEGLETYNYATDPLLTNTSRFNPNIGIGAFLKGEQYYFSLSTPGLLNTKRFEEKEGVVTQASDKLHLYASGGYDFYLASDWFFKPSFMFRYVSGIPISADITAGFLFRERFEFGATYRTDQALAGFAYIKVLEGLAIGYAYDSSLRSTLNNVGSGTHEVMLKFTFSEF